MKSLAGLLNLNRPRWFFVLFRTRNSRAASQRGKERKDHEFINSAKTDSSGILIPLALCFFALVQNTRAALPPPPPDGGYPGANTAEGTNALLNLTSGINNTAVGANALRDTTTGSYNVGIGASALASNTAEVREALDPLVTKCK